MLAVKIFDDRVCALGEGPHYDERTRQVRWVDILGSRVLWRDLDDNSCGAFDTGGHVGAAVPRSHGGFVLCMPDGPVLADPAGTVHMLGEYAEADAAAGAAPQPDGTMRSNDARADPIGRLWLGTISYAGTPGAAALYRLDPGSTCPVRVLGDITNSNGLDWSTDGSIMYYIDTPTQRVDMFDYELATGTITNRRPFVSITGGHPDGMCVDAEGCVWVALYGGGAVHRYRPDGTLEREVTVPTPQVTSCAFVGDQYDTLVITTAAQGRPDDGAAGLVYAYQPGDVAGRPVHRFAG